MEKKNIDWENIGFGYIPTDKRFVANYKDGAWDEGGLTEDPNIVTAARRFLMRSTACLRVIRFRQSGQYLTLFDFDTKNVPHSVQRFLSSVLKSSAYSSLSRGSTAI